MIGRAVVAGPVGDLDPANVASAPQTSIAFVRVRSVLPLDASAPCDSELLSSDGDDPAVLDPLSQHRADSVPEIFEFSRVTFRPWPQWVKTLHEKSFGAVHVADPGDYGLVHEEVADAAMTLAHLVDHLLSISATSEWVGAQPGNDARPY